MRSPKVPGSAVAPVRRRVRPRVRLVEKTHRPSAAKFPKPPREGGSWSARAQWSKKIRTPRAERRARSPRPGRCRVDLVAELGTSFDAVCGASRDGVEISNAALFVQSRIRGPRVPTGAAAPSSVPRGKTIDTSAAGAAVFGGVPLRFRKTWLARTSRLRLSLQI
jgi:hypothetical protein